MEPITTAIAAVTAASNAIGFIKARINDVQSVADISDQIGTLFSAQKKLNEERNKQAGLNQPINLVHGRRFLIIIIRNLGNKKKRLRKRKLKRLDGNTKYQRQLKRRLLSSVYSW